MGEASSNLARFDGVRYGYRTENYNNLEEMYLETRQEGFGREVKRRIMVGSYLLSGANAKIYYDKALSIRDDIKKEFDKVFANYDLVIGPVTTTIAYRLDSDMSDPMKSFLDDVLVIPVNMAGLPGLSLPVAPKSSKPYGLHIIGNSFDEETLSISILYRKRVSKMSEYKATIGIEVHVEVKSNTKLFSDSKNTYGMPTNTCVNPVDLGYPGTLPTLNKEVVRQGIKACHVLHCDISKVMHFDL